MQVFQFHPLTTEQAATFLDKSPADVTQLLREGVLVANSDGLISRDQLHEYLRQELSAVGIHYQRQSCCVICGGPTMDALIHDRRWPSIGGIVISMCKVHWREHRQHQVRSPFPVEHEHWPHLITYVVERRPAALVG